MYCVHEETELIMSIIYVHKKFVVFCGIDVYVIFAS